ncbi:MAG: DNA translocase FtsK 4TM domain-containing protein [Rhodospirillales bacterium]|nr:DNA translocase FtsK 4TM domain-containing protein [Rhodospirillales bacterium]
MSHPRGGAVLPPGTHAFLKRRLTEASGLGFLLAAFALLATLVTYAPGDPSLNSAADGPVHNFFGLGGALSADLLLQSFGLAGGLPGLAFAAWGWCLLHKRSVTFPWLRAGLVVLAMCLVAFGLAAFAQPENWPLASGLGGAGGDLLLAKSVSLIHMAVPGLSAGPVALIAGSLGFLSLLGALGLNRSDWQEAGEGAAKTAEFFKDGFKRGREAVEELARRERIEPVLSSGRPVRGADRTGPATGKPPEIKGLVEAKAPRAKTGNRAKAQRQGRLDLGINDKYELPPLKLLDAAEKSSNLALDRAALQQNAELLASVLDDFGIRGEIVKVRPGPVVTLYELEPAPGTKTSRVIGLSDDIARSMSAVSVRVAVVPGRNVIGIELPNARREIVNLRELLSSEPFERGSGKLTLAVGKDIGGLPVMVDLARMPHLLIAGTTGSGKSVGINTMILSLLYQFSPDECKFIMIDPKMLELSVYQGIPHLLTPVVTEPGKAVMALKWAVREMEDRYRTMSQLGVRNIAGYNSRLALARQKKETLTRKVQTGFDDSGKPVFEEQPLSMDPLPLVVVVVDEMADLMLIAGKDVEIAIQRLAQMARAAGIHLIMATQRPSVDVITGTIKANFPTRISFQVTSKIDSRTILGEQGAEQLLGQGDMLYMEGGGRVTRIHGPFVSDEEVEDVVKFLKTQGNPDYIEDITEDPEESLPALGGHGGDELYDQAVALIASEGKASTSFIQRHLQIGYNRAARIIEQMENDGVVSKANRVGRREVLIGNNGDYAN